MVADHVVSHHGDWNAFITDELQSLCGLCHNSSKKLIDHRGIFRMSPRMAGQQTHGTQLTNTRHTTGEM